MATETEKKPRKGLTEKKIYSLDAVMEMKHTNISINNDIDEIIGKQTENLTGMSYGPSGDGKSVWTLVFSNEYAEKYGNVLYASYEEGTNGTLQDRIEDFLPNRSKKLKIGKNLTFEDLLYVIKSYRLRLLVIDSVNYAQFTIEQLKTLRQEFKKKKLAVWLVAFGKSKGNTDGANKLLHACDVKLFFKGGYVLSHGRGLKKPISKFLFEVEELPKGKAAKAKPVMPSLFNNDQTA